MGRWCLYLCYLMTTMSLSGTAVQIVRIVPRGHSVVPPLLAASRTCCCRALCSKVVVCTKSAATVFLSSSVSPNVDQVRLRGSKGFSVDRSNRLLSGSLRHQCLLSFYRYCTSSVPCSCSNACFPPVVRPSGFVLGPCDGVGGASS